MATLKDFEILRDKVEEARRKADRAQGAFDAALRDLKQTFQVKTVEEAKEKLTVIEQKVATSKKAYDVAYSKFVAKHGAKLGIAKTTEDDTD